MIDSTCELQLELATAIQPVLWFAAHSIDTRDLAHTHVFKVVVDELKMRSLQLSD